MDPTTTCCPNWACPARGHIGQGNIGLHARQDRRFLCTQCCKTCSATTGTVFYRLRTSAETVVIVVTLRAHGCPVQAIVAACGFDARPVAAWWARSGRQGQAVQESLVEQPRALGQGASRRDACQETGRYGVDGAGHDGQDPLVAGRRGQRAA